MISIVKTEANALVSVPTKISEFITQEYKFFPVFYVISLGIELVSQVIKVEDSV